MSQTGFPGIQPAMLEYFVGIALNNYREYFLSTHKDYEQNVKKPLYALGWIDFFRRRKKKEMIHTQS